VPKFLVKYLHGVQESVIIEESEISIGRASSKNKICIQDPSVSRQHAQIKKNEKNYCVFDLKSLNGIFLNGKRVLKATLQHGDEIRLGDVIIEIQMHGYQEKKIDLPYSEPSGTTLGKEQENETTLAIHRNSGAYENRLKK